MKCDFDTETNEVVVRMSIPEAEAIQAGLAAAINTGDIQGHYNEWLDRKGLTHDEAMQELVTNGADAKVIQLDQGGIA